MRIDDDDWAAVGRIVCFGKHATGDLDSGGRIVSVRWKSNVDCRPPRLDLTVGNVGGYGAIPLGKVDAGRPTTELHPRYNGMLSGLDRNARAIGRSATAG